MGMGLRRGTPGVAIALATLLLGASAASAGDPGVMTLHPIPSRPAGPQGIVAGPDGAEWFIEIDTGNIGRLAHDGSFTEFPTPNGGKEFLRGITVGPDGALWFTDSGSCVNDNCDYLVNGRIGRITVTGQVTIYPVPVPKADPWNITLGPDGNLWFTETGDYFNPDSSNYAAIGRITPSGRLTEFLLPSGSGPNGITVGPDGALWFTENGTSKIGRITTGGSISESVIPTPDSAPIGITTGADGALWFTEQFGQRIGRVTTAGSFTEYPLPHGGNPVGITAGADRALWFTEVLGHRIGRITTDGSISELPITVASGPPAFPLDIATGPHGKNVYFGAVAANIIGEVNVQGDCGAQKCP